MAKQRRVMRGRSQTDMSNSSVVSLQACSERPLLSLLTAVLHSSSVPWKSPALTWIWRRRWVEGLELLGSLQRKNYCWKGNSGS